MTLLFCIYIFIPRFAFCDSVNCVGDCVYLIILHMSHMVVLHISLPSCSLILPFSKWFPQAKWSPRTSCLLVGFASVSAISPTWSMRIVHLYAQFAFVLWNLQGLLNMSNSHFSVVPLGLISVWWKKAGWRDRLSLDFPMRKQLPKHWKKQMAMSYLKNPW